jgi:hypothetical protein
MKTLGFSLCSERAPEEKCHSASILFDFTMASLALPLLRSHYGMSLPCARRFAVHIFSDARQRANSCGDSRTYRAQTMRGNKSWRTKTRILNRRQPKALYSTVYFSKVDPVYKCQSFSFYREANGLFTFREYPHVKRIKTECARLFLGDLQLGLHVIGASWCHAANRGAFLVVITCAYREKTFNLL